MKYIKLYENIDFDFDWADTDFDFEEEEPLKFKVGDEVYLPMGKYGMKTSQKKLYSNRFRGVIDGEYKLSKLDNGIIAEIRKMKDGTPVFRLEGQWPFRKFDNWIKK